jgi:hypothetical protein
MVAAGLAGEAASAAMPPLLLTSTIRNAVAFATKSVGGAIPTRVAELAIGLLRAMATAKLQGLAALLIAVGFTVIGGGLCAKNLLVTHREVEPLVPATTVVATAQQEPDGKTLITGASYNDPVVRAWDALTGKPRGEWTGHASGIHSLTVTPDGKQVASSGQDRTIRFWHLDTGKQLRRIATGKAPAFMISYSPDGKLLALGGNTGIHLLDAVTGREVRSFRTEAILRLAFAPDGKTLATAGSQEAFVRLWDVASGRELRHFPGCKSGSVLAFSPDGRALATGVDDGTVHAWDPATGRELCTLGATAYPAAGTAYIIGSIAFSRDGRVVAAGYSDGTLGLLEMASGLERARFQGHRGGILAVAFSNDGSLLATGSWDRTAVVWDVTGSIRADGNGARGVTLDPKQGNQLWADLADSDAVKAYEAMKTLIRAPATVNLLGRHLKTAAPADETLVNRLVANLDSNDFAVRDEAARELVSQGDVAEPILRRALTRKPSLEARRRIEDILARIGPRRSGRALRDLRAIEILERIGTAEARQVLSVLAIGSPHAQLTRDAKASLERLVQRESPP